VEVFPIKVERKGRKFDLFDTITNSGFKFSNHDVLVISSKFVSISEGSTLRLSDVKPSNRSRRLADRFQMDQRLADIVLREADIVLSGIPGFLLTIKDGMIAPNAGIDKSNAPLGHIILYPKNSFKTAERLRSKFMSTLGVRLGVVISDSRLMPTRIGTTGIAIGVSGIEPVEDLRGLPDLFGRKLLVTMKAVADDLATIGVFMMGESNESVPIVVIRGAKVKFTGRKISYRDLTVDARNDIYLGYDKLHLLKHFSQ
jgi:coenzyme F420-0:L-glutamate ligase/coenzyme F420-1:gamma-L-glutamate ligase